MTVARGLYDGIFLAFLATMAIVFIVGAASLPICYGLPKSADDVMAALYIGLMSTMVAFPVAAIASLFIGVPLFAVLRRRGYTSPLNYFVAGILMSAVVTGLVFAAHQFKGFLTDSDFYLSLWMIAIAGPVAALTVKYVSEASI